MLSPWLSIMWWSISVTATNATPTFMFIKQSGVLYFIKALLTHMTIRILPILSCSRVSAFSLMFRSKFHFDFSLMYTDRHVSSFSFWHVESQCLLHHFLKSFYWFHWKYLVSLSSPSVFDIVSASPKLFHWHLGVLCLPVPCYFQNSGSVVWF